jgi:hypothetical protein
VAEPLDPVDLTAWLDRFEERWHMMIGEEPLLPLRIPRRYMG